WALTDSPFQTWGSNRLTVQTWGSNRQLKFNFGGEEFKNPPKTGFVAVDQASEGHVVKSSQTGSVKVSEVKAASCGPKALIVEPSKELAEQTLNNVNQCKRYVDNPKLRDLLIIGGVPARDQLAVLEQGVGWNKLYGIVLRRSKAEL
ncbi:unnamed protein product, partial [Oncorhynchus mykiss]